MFKRRFLALLIGGVIAAGIWTSFDSTRAFPFIAPTPTPTPVATSTPAASASSKATPTPKKTKATPTPKAKKVKATPTPKPITEAAVKKEMMRLIGIERKTNSVGALKQDKGLDAAANIRAKEIAQKFSHTRPDGTFCITVHSKARGENILTLSVLPQTETSEQLARRAIESWIDSPAHHTVMMYPSFKIVGLGYYLEDGIYYCVQLFGY